MLLFAFEKLKLFCKPRIFQSFFESFWNFFEFKAFIFFSFSKIQVFQSWNSLNSLHWTFQNLQKFPAIWRRFFLKFVHRLSTLHQKYISWLASMSSAFTFFLLRNDDKISEFLTVTKKSIIHRSEQMVYYAKHTKKFVSFPLSIFLRSLFFQHTGTQQLIFIILIFVLRKT